VEVEEAAAFAEGAATVVEEDEEEFEVREEGRAAEVGEVTDGSLKRRRRSLFSPLPGRLLLLLLLLLLLPPPCSSMAAPPLLVVS